MADEIADKIVLVIPIGSTVRRRKRTRRERAVGKLYFDTGVVFAVDTPLNTSYPTKCRVNWQAGRTTRVNEADLICLGT